MLKIGVMKMKVSSINNIQGISSKQITKEPAKSPEVIGNQISDISNVYYKPLSFGRTWSEHKSWGAMIDPKTKETTFKLFTYPDSKRVTVTVKKHNNPKQIKTYELKNQGNGIFETKDKIPAGEVEHGDKYSYTIYKGNGDVDTVKDPYSFRQEKLLGESVVYDHSLYKWKDDSWFKSNKARISRKANKQNQLTPVDSARIYEFNTATLTKGGTFKTAKGALSAIKQAGFNAIEIMPVENTYSYNWGYDGVDKFAPSEHRGGPDQLKDFIDYAHNIGLNVIMDVVPNHLGPDGASLLKTGPYIKGTNCFGEAFNYEGENSRYVRDYIVNASLNWLDNYHCDGLRLDMTKFMDSDYTMKQIAAEVNYHKPEAFLIAEDARDGISVDNDGNFWTNYGEVHDKRVVNPLRPEESGEYRDEDVHCDAIEKISNGDTSLGRLGYDSEWDFNYHHTLEDGLYDVLNLDRFETACYCAQDSVKYVMSHDEIGNKEGSRLIAKLMVPMLHLNEIIELNDKDEERAHQMSIQRNMHIDDAYRTVHAQKAQFVAEDLAIMFQTGQLDKYDTSNINLRRKKHQIDTAFNDEVLLPLGIKSNSGITYDNIKAMFMKSFNKNKMALARTYSIPGPKMVFQGDEKAELTPFRFFREFDSVKDEKHMQIEKGYNTGLAGYQESTIGNITYSPAGRNLMNKFRNLTRDLNQLNAENSSLTRGYLIVDSTIKNPDNVFATHALDPERKNEIFSITNFGDNTYPRKDAAEYYIKFPKGVWVEKLNTDDKKYGGEGNINGINLIHSDGEHQSPIKLSGQTTAIFKRIK